MDIKFKDFLNTKSENNNDNNTNNATILKEFHTEKEKLKEENEKILAELKNLEAKYTEIIGKIKDFPSASAANKIFEKVKLFEMEMEENPTKNDIKHICNELDKYENELSKFKSFMVSQNETNSKFKEELSKIKNMVENIKKTFSSISKLFENNSLNELLENLNELSSKMVEREEFNQYKKEISKNLLELRMNVNEHNRSLDQVMPLVQKILTIEDLNKLEASLTELIEKKNALATGKFADKKEIIKSIKAIEAQVKVFMKKLDNEREKEKNDGVILASRPVPGYKCASCEAYIGDIKESYTYLPWNKIHGAERPYRLGSSFSRILQGLNLENTFNPFIQKNYLKTENTNKFVLTNNCLTTKKDKHADSLPRVPSEHNLVKNITIDEPYHSENSKIISSSLNKKYHIRNFWGNKTLRSIGNETNFENKSTIKETSFNRYNQQSRGREKLVKASKTIINTNINSSEDVGNHFLRN